MKKTLISILPLIFIAMFTVSCTAVPDNISKDVGTAKLGDTGYSMILADDFERISFFDKDGKDVSDNVYGVYENDKSYIMVYGGNADTTLEEELQMLLDEIIADDIYVSAHVINSELLTTTGYESARFDADIEWEDGRKENVSVLLIKCGDKGATVYYFIPQGDVEEAQKRETILSRELVKQ